MIPSCSTIHSQLIWVDHWATHLGLHQKNKYEPPNEVYDSEFLPLVDLYSFLGLASHSLCNTAGFTDKVIIAAQH